MNEIDFRVIHTVCGFYTRTFELPRLCLVHPSWYQRLTINRVYVHISERPTAPQERSQEERARALAETYEQHSVPIDQLSLRSLPPGVRYQLPQSQWIRCLTRRDILLSLEMHADRHLTEKLPLSWVMAISEDERYWLTKKREKEEVERREP